MTEDNKESLLHFVTRMGMYIHPVEASSVAHFIHGFEAGAGNKRAFTEPLRNLIFEKYKVVGGCLGWPEQIKHLAKKRSLSWLTTFRRLVPELIVETQEGELTPAQQAILRKRIDGWLDRIELTGNPWFNAGWAEEWQALCAVKSGWFKQLWTRQEWSIIRAIDKLVQTDGLFSDAAQRLPSPALLQLKDAYVKTISKNKVLPEA